MNLLKFTICLSILTFTSTYADSIICPYVKLGAKGTLIKNELAENLDDSTIIEDSKPEYISKVMPMIGIGLRRIEGNFGTDISADYSWKLENDETIYSYSAPKVMFLGYFHPQKFTSLYAGLGTSWSGLELENNNFHGLFGNASVGAEFNHTSKLKGMVELNCDVPAVAAVSAGDYPYPLVSLRIGVGF